MKKLVKLVLPVSVLAVVTFSSCEKVLDDATETTDSAEDMASEQVAISALSDMAIDIVSTEGFMQKNGGSILPSGSWIDYVDSSFSDGDGIQIIVNLGEIDLSADEEVNISDFVTGKDKKKRKGKLTIKANHPYSHPNCKITVNFTGKVYVSIAEEKWVYISEGPGAYAFTLTRENSNTWKLDYSLRIYQHDHSGDDWLHVDGVAVGSFTIVNTDGGSAGVLDDQFEITGSSTGKNRKGKNYTVTITDKLLRKADPECSNTFVSGAITLKNDGSKTDIKMDFGDGTCDNDVVVTLPGNIKKTITIE